MASRTVWTPVSRGVGMRAAAARCSSSSAQTPGQPNRRARDSFLRRNVAPLSPPMPPPSRHEYSPLTVSLVKGIGRLMGYNFVRSKAINVTGDLYDRCAQRAEAEAHFWYTECALPASFQIWFQLTNLHIFLLLSRFRALPPNEARTYSQELMNHFFIDVESRMRERFGVQTARLVKGYMKDLHTQHRGSMIAYDEGLATDDVRLSAAVWRNVWGGGWGTIGGVKRKTSVDKVRRGEQVSPDAPAEVVLDPVLNDEAPQHDTDAESLAERAARAEMLFPQHLERVTRWLRREIYRLGHLPDSAVVDGDVYARRSDDDDAPPPLVSAYSRI
ncbi:beta-ketoacyl-[acyl-carrier-protein] synthase II [Malassezia cuniculi]|uniref:Beta-ketoacyl-[acyl-carrier-protein] synthase II n=1 Tax=Malassezia cuniculi TaxID=948313 RepID=A0AAF0EQF4_9BASI|nr:beta-ketoacyl-[acyl-carrier-protein] synthase II [Malassezia cuniculi]